MSRKTLDQGTKGETARPGEDTIVCRCEDLTLADIRHWLDRGCLTLDELKRMSRCGMGPCGGRTCRPLVAREIARRRGVPAGDVELPRFRPPTRPVKLGALALLEGEEGKKGGTAETPAAGRGGSESNV